MDVSGMTIEGFFLADYARKSERVEQLEAKVKELEEEVSRYNDQYGVTDLHRKTETVRYDVVSSYTLREYFQFTKLEIKTALELDDVGLYEFACSCKPKKNSYSNDKLIKRTEQTYLYTVHVKETRKEYDAYFDGAGGYIKKIPDEPGIDAEVLKEFDEQSKQFAIDCLREKLQDLLDDMEKENE